MEIQINKVILNDQNPRGITDEKFEKLVDSILVFPKMLKVRPIVVNKEMIVLGGNMRCKALRHIANMDFDVICHRLNENKTFLKKTDYERSELFTYWKEWKSNAVTPYLNAEELTEDEQREFIIKDNVGYGEWDEEILKADWDKEELDDWGVDMAWDTDNMQQGSNTAEDDDFDEDKAEIETRAQRGDIWILGDHRLMCGDSTSETDMAELMDGQEADLWLTDPPYNVNYAEKERYKEETGYGSTIHEVEIANDSMGDTEFREFLVNAFSAAKSVMRSGASFYIWHADTEGFNFRGALRDIGGMKFSENLVWAKNQMVFGRQDYHWKHEPCLYGWKEGAGHDWYSDRSQTTILEFDRPQRADLHPTMKPLPLFGYLINNSSKAGDIVLDTFGGSGTTLICCEQMGRKARLMELEPHYCDVIIARWEQLTGKTAVKE